MKRKYHNLDEGIGNREVSMFAKKCKLWCSGCDMQLVGPGEKCSNCGYIDRFHSGRYRRKSKKEKERYNVD